MMDKRRAPTRNTPFDWLLVFIVGSFAPPALARDSQCDARARTGAICLCEIADLHPTQTSVGMTEVARKAEKLRAKRAALDEAAFRAWVRKREKEEPVIVGPGGVLYITDHHHLARALADIGVAETYCTITANLSDSTPDAFWSQLEAGNKVYLKDQNGDPITPKDLPASVRDLTNNPFRSLAGAVRASCGFEKGDPKSGDEDFIEFEWADYLRAHWAQAGVPAADIDADFGDATLAALKLAARNDAAGLPGWTGKTACD
jgi:hypothetical protein